MVVVFLFLLRWERPLRSLRKDSLSDFFNDFRLDMGLSSALAMSKNKKSNRYRMHGPFQFKQFCTTIYEIRKHLKQYFFTVP